MDIQAHLEMAVLRLLRAGEAISGEGNLPQGYIPAIETICEMLGTVQLIGEMERITR